MNILIPRTWLDEHLKTNASDQDIQKYLSLSGPSVEKLIPYQLSSKKQDTIFDIEITTNRVDLMSVAGLAREAATILKRAGFKAKLINSDYPAITEQTAKTLKLPEIVYQTEEVKRVMTVVLDNITDQASPQLIQDRLQEIGVNVHSALIDVTNYITHELGHPCHIFDYDQIMAMGGKIIITEAKAGKKFITLDGEEHQTVGGEIVFENPAGEIIDLPAVKGTSNTGVTSKTKRALLWIESITASKVRYASMSHAIRTVAAQLNEKNVDPQLAEPVLKYGVKLLKQLTNAQVASDLYDYFPQPTTGRNISLSTKLIDQYLGLKLPLSEMKQILTDLGCQVSSSKQGSDCQLSVQTPSYRADMSIAADVIEEIARIYGYQRLPSKLMVGALPTMTNDHLDFTIERQIKQLLADRAWQEIYSYSLVSQEEALMSGYSLKQHLKLQNPLKEENTYLRRSLIPSLWKIIQDNPQEKDLQLFELARIYQPQKDQLPKQDFYLTLLSRAPYRQFRADLEILLNRLYILNSWGGELLVEEQLPRKHQLYHQGAKLVIKKGNKRHLLGRLDVLEDRYLAAEINWASLLKLAHAYPHYQATSKQAIIVEQLTLTLPKGAAVGELMRSLKTVDPCIVSIELDDIYQNNYTFTINYQSQNINLSNQDVEPIRQQLVKKAKDKFQAQLVGQL